MDIRRPAEVCLKACRQRSVSTRLGAIWIGGLIVLCGSIAYVGVAPDRAVPCDLFIVLDGAWRVLQGQRPHIDFYTPLGPLMYMIFAAGLWLRGLDVRGVGLALGITGLIVGLGAWRLSRRRMGAMASVAISWMMALLVITPRPIGYVFRMVSHASSFNRLGYALLGLVAIESLWVEEPNSGASARDVGGAMSTGLLCAVLLFLKVTYGLAAIGLVGVGLVLGNFDYRRIGVIALAFSLTVFGMLWYLQFGVSAVWSDLKIAGGGRLLPKEQIIRGATDGLPAFVLLFMIATVCSFCKRWSVDRWRWPLTALAVTVLGLCLGITNTFCPPVHLAALLGIMMGDWIAVRQPLGCSPRSNSIQASMLAAIAVLVLVPAVTDALSLTWAVLPLRNASQRRMAHLSPPHIASFVAVNGNENPNLGTDFLDGVEDGIQLLKTHSRPEDSVMAMEFANPFEYALQRPVARGGATNLRYKYTYTDNSKPGAEWLIGNYSYVMIPKQSVDFPWSFQALMRNYGSYINSHFAWAAESRHWVLYRRLPPDGSGG
jgi:hypothetical protein